MGALPDEEAAPYEATMAVYGSTRMLLACTDPELARLLVCCRQGGAGGVEALLQPLRAVRPVNGGKGCNSFDDDVARLVCSLAFDV